MCAKTTAAPLPPPSSTHTNKRFPPAALEMELNDVSLLPLALLRERPNRDIRARTHRNDVSCCRYCCDRASPPPPPRNRTRSCSQCTCTPQVAHGVTTGTSSSDTTFSLGRADHDAHAQEVDRDGRQGSRELVAVLETTAAYTNNASQRSAACHRPIIVSKCDGPRVRHEA